MLVIQINEVQGELATGHIYHFPLVQSHHDSLQHYLVQCSLCGFPYEVPESRIIITWLLSYIHYIHDQSKLTIIV